MNPWEQYTNEIPDTLLDIAASYPYIQWVNDGQTLQPRQSTGGWAMPADQAVDSLIPGDFSELVHRNGTMTDVVFARELALVPLRTRFCWVQDGNRLPKYAEGARGKLQVLCFTHGNDGQSVVGPFMLTVKGMASKQLAEILKAHAQAVRKLTNGKGQPWMFWLILSAGEIKVVGKGSQRSPITTLARNGDPTAGDFVGDEVVRRILALADEAEAWVAAWRDDQGGPNDNGEGGDEEDEALPPASPPPASKPANGAPMSLPTALKVKTPLASANFAEGVELGALVKAGENGLGFLKWLKGQPKHAEAQKAATVILNNLTEAVRLVHTPAPPPDDDPDDGLPF